MEEAQYWMWMKRRQLFKHSSSYNFQATSMKNNIESWEERAFAEDAAGHLGGCTWPPRSYSCSFCKREFRSAQALGGHMNVHRRDRARLKQSHNCNNHNSNDDDDVVVVVSQQPHHHQHQQQPYTLNFPSVDHEVASTTATTNSSSRVSVVSSYSTHEKNPTNYHNSSFSMDTQKQHQASSDSDSAARFFNIADSKADRSVAKSDTPNCFVDTNLVMGLTNSDGVIFSSKKRAKTDVYMPCSIDKSCALQSELLVGLSSASMEDLDLELRLGHGRPPRVK